MRRPEGFAAEPSSTSSPPWAGPLDRSSLPAPLVPGTASLSSTRDPSVSGSAVFHLAPVAWASSCSVARNPAITPRRADCSAERRTESVSTSTSLSTSPLSPPTAPPGVVLAAAAREPSWPPALPLPGAPALPPAPGSADGETADEGVLLPLAALRAVSRPWRAAALGGDSSCGGADVGSVVLARLLLLPSADGRSPS